VCEFGLAINNCVKKGDERCFIDVVLHCKSGEYIAENASKGSDILVDGRPVYRQWGAITARSIPSTISSPSTSTMPGSQAAARMGAPGVQAGRRVSASPARVTTPYRFSSGPAVGPQSWARRAPEFRCDDATRPPASEFRRRNAPVQASDRPVRPTALYYPRSSGRRRPRLPSQQRPGRSSGEKRGMPEFRNGRVQEPELKTASSWRPSQGLLAKQSGYGPVPPSRSIYKWASLSRRDAIFCAGGSP
jgi:single-stranded DNA-binding protein